MIKAIEPTLTDPNWTKFFRSNIRFRRKTLTSDVNTPPPPHHHHLHQWGRSPQQEILDPGTHLFFGPSDQTNDIFP